MPRLSSVFVFYHDVGQILRRHVLAFHLQHLLGLLGLRHGDGQHKIENHKGEVDVEEETTQVEQPENGEDEEVGAEE